MSTTSSKLRRTKSRTPPPPLPSSPTHSQAIPSSSSSSSSSPAPFLTTPERDVLIASLLIKFLLFPAYRSTDFEVHRNWLSITHSLPLSKWYFDTTSEWTLDYPPFFAYFERFLASFAFIVDPEIVRLGNLGYDQWSCVAFQRTTVVLSELVLVFAVLRWARSSKKPDYPTAFVIASSIIFHPGLIIVDHIHFQYNGFLLGILLWSIVAARDGNLYACAALFATLLNFKHIFIYLAPPYFVFLFRRHCFSPRGFQSDRLVELGALVTAIFGISFGPFLLVGGIDGLKQIVSRLFPFQRGLNHAYWAGNIWAVYSAVDRVAVRYLIKRGWPISPEALTSASRGLIGTTTFGVLPPITPSLTFSITLSISFIYLTKLWFDPTFKRFLDSLVLSAMTSFLWGWHVHEKAVLLFLIPLSLAAAENDNHYKSYVVATTAGVYSLFPLLIRNAETPIKVLVTAVWSFVVFASLRKVVYRPLPNLFSMLVSYAEFAYLFGFGFLHLYVTTIHYIIFPTPLSSISTSSASIIECADGSIANETCSLIKAAAQPVAEGAWAFLPLMLTSLYCAVGIIWSWLRLSWEYLRY